MFQIAGEWRLWCHHCKSLFKFDNKKALQNKRLRHVRYSCPKEQAKIPLECPLCNHTFDKRDKAKTHDCPFSAPSPSTRSKSLTVYGDLTDLERIALEKMSPDELYEFAISKDIAIPGVYPGYQIPIMQRSRGKSFERYGSTHGNELYKGILKDRIKKKKDNAIIVYACVRLLDRDGKELGWMKTPFTLPSVTLFKVTWVDDIQVRVSLRTEAEPAKVSPYIDPSTLRAYHQFTTEAGYPYNPHW